MYSSTKQSGRSRVNWVSDSRQNKNKKSHVQNKEVKKHEFDHFYKIQDRLLKEGLNLQQYENYLQEKINNHKFHYRNLSENHVTVLKERYSRVLKKRDDRYHEIGEKKKMNRRQRMLFREKKRTLIHEQQRFLIEELLQKVSRGKHLSSDPTLWSETKKNIYRGQVVDKQGEKSWIEIYKRIVSPVKAHLFNLHSNDALNQYVYDH